MDLPSGAGASDPNGGDGPSSATGGGGRSGESGLSTAVAVAVAVAAAAAPSRYESQKRRDWNTFLQYLKNHKPPLTLARCSGPHVIEFLKYLDQFGKIKVHLTGCPYFGQPQQPAPCACPLRQAWGSLDALIARLRAVYEENGGRPESNPFGARAVRIYLREVREVQVKARGIPYEKKKRPVMSAKASAAAAATPASQAADVGASVGGGSGGGDGINGGAAAATISPINTTPTTTAVTAQAPEAHSQMQNQAEFPSSASAAPASLLPQPPPFTSSAHPMLLPGITMEPSDLPPFHLRSSHSFTYQKEKNLTRKNNHPLSVNNPAENSYDWRRYGRKGLLGGGTRNYYKCTHPGCRARKKVQFSPNGQITETILGGLHNHQPPQGSAELTKEGHIGNLNKSEGVPAYTLSEKDQESSQVTTGNMSGPDESEGVGHSEGRVDGRDEDDSQTERSSEMSVVIHSERNKLHSGPPVLSTDSNWIIKREAESLRNRAWHCSRRKDLLLLLMSFPIKLEGDEVAFSLLWDNLVKLDQMIDTISEDDMADVTNLGELMEETRALLKDVENCLGKYDDDINLYFNRKYDGDINLYFNRHTHDYASLEKHCIQVDASLEKHYIQVVDSVTRQILKCLELERLGVIRIYGAHVEGVTRALEGLVEITSMFQPVIRVSVFPQQTISEIRNHIAEKVRRLLGTDISLPLDAALKPYKFLLLLHCTCLRTDLYDLKIPENGSVVLTTSKGWMPGYNAMPFALQLMPEFDAISMFDMMPKDVRKIMLLDVQIRMEDHLLPWTLFWNHLRSTRPEILWPATSESFRALEVEKVGTQLIQTCHNHLLAIILLAKALESEYDVRVWKLALQELQSLPKPSSAVEGINEVMVCVIKFIWERKGIVTKHLIKQCTSATEDGAVKMHSLVACWLKNDLVKSKKEGNRVLWNLIESSFLHKVGEDSVRMQRETRDVLLSRFIPRLHPLYLMQEGLGLSKAPEVEEWGAKVIINLSNNNLSELPEKPNCRSLQKLFLQKNRDLMLIPPSSFEYMSGLLILDLSYTSIQSFPASIARLVCLKELLLRGCELLTELPSEIGLLRTLEVLDLEGTEIMYLPEELSKLRQLTRFKVSLYGYGECYRVSKQIRKRIPEELLAGFYRLKELSIDVNPDDEEWVADVKDIVYELADRGKLEMLTLKLYLPEVELLKETLLVRNFKFIVGLHKQRIVSCLPQEVKEEFEKQENYLKYINGKCVPTEIQNTLSRTGAFFLERHWTVKKLSEFGNKSMVKLKFCLLVECNELQTIIDEEEFCREGSQKDESVFDRKPVLESLEYLGVHCMISLRSIFEGPVGKGSLSKLKYLSLHDCPSLNIIFALSLLGNLCNLEELIVEDCPEIKSLVSQESSCSKSSQFLPSLKKISLLDLPELVSISSGFCIAPKLERIIIYACPMLESLSPAELSSDYLKVIKGEIEWWTTLKWNESEWSSTQLEYMNGVFVALKRDEWLMDPLARS